MTAIDLLLSETPSAVLQLRRDTVVSLIYPKSHLHQKHGLCVVLPPASTPP